MTPRIVQRDVAYSELAGEVEAVGVAVSEFAVGDHVFGISGFSFGAHAEFICIRQSDRIAHKPASISFEEAATICDGGAVAVIPWNSKRQKNRSCLPPTWTKEELGKRSDIQGCFGRVFLFFHLQRPPLYGWSEITSQVALTYAASVIGGLAAQQAGRPDLIRSPKRVLAHLWEEDSQF